MSTQQCDERLQIVKYINDPVYGGIPLTKMEVEIIDTPVFQRLRGLSQLARVNYVFPGAEHSRFVHSLGVLYIMGLMTDHLLRRREISEEDAVKMRAAALLHDIGHYPFSHLGETVYGYLKDNENASGIFDKPPKTDPAPLYELSSAFSKTANHEYLGKYVVTHNNDIVRILKQYSLDPEEIGQIFTGEIGSQNMVYSQLLHSSLDADRLDYLLRDSYQTGVKYGLVDLQYLIRLLMVVTDPDMSGNKKILVCNKKGQHVVEHFLMSRYFHYSQVIFHKTNAAFEGMIKAMYIKLVQNKAFVFNSVKEIHDNINNESFLSFRDSSLEVAFEKFYNETDDDDYKVLFNMYKKRVRPKVVYEIKDLSESSTTADYSILRWNLKRSAERITEILGKRWGYQDTKLRIERIRSQNKVSEDPLQYSEELREAIKLYDEATEDITYLAEDKLSIIGRLADLQSIFLRIYVLEEKQESFDFEKIHSDIDGLIRV